jgi:hypothetical protein
MAVIHKLAKVRPNGLPEAEYNDSLRTFDHDVIEFIECEGEGIVVVIETFAGKRHYYSYVDAAATFKARFEQLKSRYPQHDLTVGHGMDPEWSGWETYRKLFPWPSGGPTVADAFPNDSDGDALRRVIAGGSDPSKPMLIDFQVAVPDMMAANKLASAASKLGFNVRAYASPECSLPWTCECSKRMLATYEGVVAVQNELRELSGPLGGHPDGWGTLGNSSEH